MNSAFLVFDLVAGDAGLEVECNTRNRIEYPASSVLSIRLKRFIDQVHLAGYMLDQTGRVPAPFSPGHRHSHLLQSPGSRLSGHQCLPPPRSNRTRGFKCRRPAKSVRRRSCYCQRGRRARGCCENSGYTRPQHADANQSRSGYFTYVFSCS